jgi:hypothetical protein
MGRERSRSQQWTPGLILPEKREPRRPISLRVPPELYEELGAYAKRVGTTRTYLILECVRRMLAADGAGQAGTKTLRRRRSE